ncbi:MAG: Shedu anti-phage system protein SduA domain-containing protein [Candidatus Angelobacter sp.]
MFDKNQPTPKDLQRTRDEFREMLELRTNETQWQKFFSENPYVLSMSLPLRLAPQDILALGRPGRSEPDFVFYAKNLEPLPTYGVIEIKRPDSKVITLTRSNAAILSRDAETAIQQAMDYSLTQQRNHLQPRQDSILILGNQAHLFVIMGMSTEFGRKLSVELYKEMIEKRLPQNLRLIPYDTLLKRFEGQVPTPLLVLVPPSENRLDSIQEGSVAPGSVNRAILERSIEALVPWQRIVYVLHDIEGYEQGEVAEMLGNSLEFSKNTLYKARSRLLTLFQRSSGISPDVGKQWLEAIKKEFADRRLVNGRKRG